MASRVSRVRNGDTRGALIEAASTCIVRRGNARISMSEVAEEAGVARSTLYRHFPGRAEMVVGVLLSRVDAALRTVVAGLADPDDAAGSIPEIVLGPLAMVEGSPLNEALFSPTSEGYVTEVELGSEPLVDAMVARIGPLLEKWQAGGQLYADLDVRETVRWINAVALVLLAPPWRRRSEAEKREFLDQYLVRALVPRRR